MKTLLRLLILCVLLLPSLAQATTFWDDDFESPTNYSNWSYFNEFGYPQAMLDVSTSAAKTGTQSIKGDYSQSTGTNGGGPFITRNFPSSTTHIFGRFTYNTPTGFFDSSNGLNKILQIYNNSTGGYPIFWIEWLYGYWMLTIEGGFDCVSQSNQSSGPISIGSWQDLEYEILLNTPGVSNGVARLWKNGALILELLNRQFVGPDNTTVNCNGLLARADHTLNANKIFIQEKGPTSDVAYYDRVAVGDTRIGCVTTCGAISDTTPPSPAPVLSITANGSATWTASTDNVGVTSYTVLFCTPAVCTPSQTVTTTSNLFATVTQTGDYAVWANDAAGNHSVLSNVVAFTAPTLFRTTLATDDFARANNTDLGANWDPGYTSMTNFQIVSGILEQTIVNTNSVESYNAVAAPNDQWARITIHTIAGALTEQAGVMLRMSTPGALTGYLCYAQMNNASIKAGITRWNGTTNPDVGTNYNGTDWLSGDILDCEVQGTALILSRIRSGSKTVLVSGTDATYASGRVGLNSWTATGGAVTDVQFGNFAFGGFSATPPTPPAVTSLTTDSLGLNETSTGSPTSFRLRYWDSAFVNVDVTIQSSEIVSGRYLITWPQGTIGACLFAKDALGNENDATDAYVCTTVTPGAVDHGPATGVLRQLGSTPWLTNDSGNALVLVGRSGVYTSDGSAIGYPNPAFGCLQDDLNSSTPPVNDYDAAFAEVVTRGHTFVRCWTVHRLAFGTAAQFAANTYERIPLGQMPWLQVGTRVDNSTGTAITVEVDDLTQWNPVFWNRVRTRVLNAVNKGLTVSVMLFNYLDTRIFDYASFSNPFYNGNNVNGINADIDANTHMEEIATLPAAYSGANATMIANVNAFQVAYVKKMIDTLNDIDGIIWEICNECRIITSPSSQAWQDMIADTITTYEAAGGRKVHPVWHTAASYTGAPDDGGNATILADTHVQLYGVGIETGQAYGTNPPVNTTKPIVFDSDHSGSGPGPMTSGWPWRSFTRGIHPVALDGQEDAATRTLLSQQLGQVASYAAKMHLAGMLPVTDTSVIATGYGLKEDCQEYLMFQPSAATNAIDLTSCGGSTSFTVEYLNPTTGAVTSDANVIGGASRNFTAAAMRVVYLKLDPTVDLTPPTVFGALPSGVLPSGTTSSTYQVSTSEPGTCRIGGSPNVLYASKTITMTANAAGTTHTFPTATLTNGTSYNAYVRCIDTAGNATTSDTVIAFSVAAQTDATPPMMSTPLPNTTLPAGTTSTIISLTLDEPASCKYDTTDIAYASMANSMATTSLTASATVSGLTDNSTTTLYARCQDVAQPTPNTDTASLVITVVVAAAAGDTTVPSTVTGLVGTAVSQTQVQLTWTAATDNVAVSGYQVFVCFVSDCSDAMLVAALGNVTTTIVNLSASTTYYFAVKAVDSSNNLSAALSNIVSVTTPAPLDVVPPSTMTNLRILNGQVFRQSATLTWDQGTDDRGSVFVTIEVCPHAESVCVESDFVTVVSKVALDYLVVGLAPSTTYTARGIFSDAAGNTSLAYSNLLEFTTLASGIPRPRLPVPFGSDRSSSGSRSSSGTRTPRP